jgi:hypothetical protein
LGLEGRGPGLAALVNQNSILQSAFGLRVPLPQFARPRPLTALDRLDGRAGSIAPSGGSRCGGDVRRLARSLSCPKAGGQGRPLRVNLDRTASAIDLAGGGAGPDVPDQAAARPRQSLVWLGKNGRLTAPASSLRMQTEAFTIKPLGIVGVCRNGPPLPTSSSSASGVPAAER